MAAVRIFAADPAVVPAVNGATLLDCYQRAKTISETVGIAQENITLAEAQIRTERGAVFPHINWIKTQEFQDTSGNTSGASAVASSLARSPIPTSFFQIQQPIFAGLRDWRALDIAKSVREQSKYNRVQADLQLLSDVATAFYNTFTLEQQLTVLQDVRKISQDRIEQLRHWVNVGRSREDEVISEETQMAVTDAQIEDTKRSLIEARHLLFFLTQVPVTTPLIDNRSLPALMSSEDALTLAWKRPDLLATAEMLRQANLNVRYAKGAHWPTVDAVGNYYTERVGFLSDIRWDATITLDVPLFEGGSTQAGVDLARSQEIIAQLTLARMKRDVERQVRSTNDSMQYALSTAVAYNKAVDMAIRNYKVQEREYSRGTISNLELLQTLRDTQNTRTQAILARASAKLNDVLLHVALGEGL